MQPLFDDNLHHLRLNRSNPQDNFLQSSMREILLDRLQDIEREFVDNEVMDSMPSCDENTRDAVLIAGMLHRTNDVVGLLVQAMLSLKPDGLFLAAFPGGETLFELRESLMQAELELTGGASPRVHPMIELREAAGLLQRAGFALPVADSAKLTASYETPLHLLRDLRVLGETNTLLKRSRAPLTRTLLTHMSELYANAYTDAEGRITATFDIIVMTGWKPAENQQKPARRGSGKVSLKDIF